MKSVAQAVIWELVWHNSWLALALLAVGNALPLFVLSAMSGLQVDLNSKDLAMLQVMIIYCSVLVAIGVSLGQGPISRLYLKPVSTAKLVACFFATGAIPISLGIAGSIVLWNYCFGLTWPIVTPTVIGVTFWIAIWPSTRVQMTSPARLLEVFLVVIGMSIWWMPVRPWLNSINQQWDWNNFDLLDYLFLICTVAISFTISVRRTSQDRCGNNSSRVLEAAIRILNDWDKRGSLRRSNFNDRLKANTWYEQNTRDLPYVAGIAVFIALVVIVAASALITQNKAVLNLAEWGDSLTLIFLLHVPFAGFIGLLISMLRLDVISDPKDIELSELSRHRSGAMSEFRAALPITDAELAKSSMRSMQLSLMWVHGMFAVLVLAYWGLLQYFDQSIPVQTTTRLPWIIAIGVLGSWAALANATALVYWGRWQGILSIVAIGLVVVIVASVSMAFAGVALLLLVVMGFVKLLHTALRDGLLVFREAATALATATVMAILLSVTYPRDLPPFTMLFTAILGIMVVVPIAGMRLAIRESRRR